MARRVIHDRVGEQQRDWRFLAERRLPEGREVVRCALVQSPGDHPEKRSSATAPASQAIRDEAREGPSDPRGCPPERARRLGVWHRVQQLDEGRFQVVAHLRPDKRSVCTSRATGRFESGRGRLQPRNTEPGACEPLVRQPAQCCRRPPDPQKHLAQISRWRECVLNTVGVTAECTGDDVLKEILTSLLPRNAGLAKTVANSLRI